MKQKQPQCYVRDPLALSVASLVRGVVSRVPLLSCVASSNMYCVCDVEDEEMK